MKALVRIVPFVAVAACSAPVPPPSTQPQPAAFVVSGPEEGSRAPLFTLPGATKEGPLASPFDLSLQRGRVTVIAFYPKDFTSGCTAEFTTFRDRGATIFGDSGVMVVGISIDSVDSHVRFAQSIGHPYTLLSDPDQRIAKMYGSAGEGYDRRTVYVVGKDGKVKYRNLRFGALDPKAYSDLQDAVAAAR